jgi:hypothetical protein
MSSVPTSAQLIHFGASTSRSAINPFVIRSRSSRAATLSGLRRHGSFHRPKGRRGGPHQPMSAAAEKLSLQDLYPPGRRGNVTAIKDDGGIELTRPIIEKLSLQDLYPPWPARNGTPTKGRWGWMITTALRSRCRRPKNYHCRTYTPYPWSIRANKTAFRQLLGAWLLRC